jgi:multimeric flavodoxin WrbA
MKALILDGSADGSSRRVIDALAAQIKAKGWDVDAIALREKRIAPCEGCFGCWIRTPGECIVKDDAPAVTGAMVASDLVVLLCPVTFGGYSSELKKALDRSIGLVLPFFETIGGEVHHSARYERHPSMLGVGVMRAADEEGAAMFATLVRRNAINMHCPAHAAGVVLEGDTDDALREKLRPLLSKAGAR